MVETLLAVVPTDSDPDNPAVRLKILPVPGSAPPDTADSGTLVHLLKLPK